jgi:methanogenic corrinoid protein MtbC1
LNETSVPAGALTIAAVERDTGLSKDTLRIWERRYGFPQPVRDAIGERAYPPEQVEKLRLLKRLMDNGHRPGKLVTLPIAELQLLGHAPGADQPPRTAIAAPYGELLLAHDVMGLRRQLHQAVLASGLERFVVEQIAPMNVAVGEAWMRGELSVAQEHVYTEALQLVLRQAIGSIPEPAVEAPRVLLATLPQEPHGLGLLMAEALLHLYGARCLSLGVKVPLDGIADAARLSRADIVALSFSGCFHPAQVGTALKELRQLLAPATALWAGGSNVALQRRLPEGVLAVPSIALVPQLLKDWRSTGGPPAR